MPDAGTQNRVGHDPRVFEVDDDGAVPQPGEPAQRFSGTENRFGELRSSSPSDEVAAHTRPDNRLGAGSNDDDDRTGLRPGSSLEPGAPEAATAAARRRLAGGRADAVRGRLDRPRGDRQRVLGRPGGNG